MAHFTGYGKIFQAEEAIFEHCTIYGESKWGGRWCVEKNSHCRSLCFFNHLSIFRLCLSSKTDIVFESIAASGTSKIAQLIKCRQNQSIKMLNSLNHHQHSLQNITVIVVENYAVHSANSYHERQWQSV